MRIQAMLLNADGTYLEMHSPLRAIRLAADQKVTVIHWWDPEYVIRSASAAYPIPALMLYYKYVNMGNLSRSAPLTREALFRRDNFSCLYCGKVFRPTHLTLDHIVPRDQGGKTTWLNSATACKKCNNKKSNRTPAEARMPLLQVPYAPKFVSMRAPHVASISGRCHESWRPYLDTSHAV